MLQEGSVVLNECVAELPDDDIEIERDKFIAHPLYS